MCFMAVWDQWRCLIANQTEDKPEKFGNPIWIFDENRKPNAEHIISVSGNERSNPGFFFSEW